ncbi:hypothetical protein [Pseudomonas subflava]|uniref:hypothetical protein n=1 Tax=Pseudomonas subflava TaxID=2952933 RepID=UPI0020795F87|nr:hypothetical protein [Pseudomonas subflava]
MLDVSESLTPRSTLAQRWPLWLPPLIAAFYPYLLDAFHVLVKGEGHITPAAALLLLAAFAVPALGLHLACRASGRGVEQTRARRLGLLLVATPTLYCFVGVNLYMLGIATAEGWIWTLAWLALAPLAAVATPAEHDARTERPTPTLLRVAHGVSGALVALFIAFHLFNHLLSLAGPEVHAVLMERGRQVYRAPLVEPLLVIALLFQVVTGLQLAWRWSTRGGDFQRMFQLASGVFLAVFILGHLNAVFVFARLWAGIETDWAFATGAPTGLIMDPWSIRLLPHYALGVFFVLAHLGSGLRVVLLAHGVARRTADRLWWLGAGAAALVSLAILLGMTGLRLG